MTKKNYYIVTLDRKKGIDLADVNIQTYSIDNKAVKELSLWIHNEFYQMDKVSNEVNDILNQSTGHNHNQN